MWIIPNNLQLLSGAPDTAGFISDLNEQSQICASSLMVRSKPSPSRTWSLKWKRDSWTALLSGRILKHSHARTFVTEWTSLWPVIPASHSPQQERDSAPMTRATSGHTSPDQYELFAPECVFSRTSKDTSALDSERSLESWNQWVTKCRGEYSLRVKSARHTKENESSSWPTIRASEYKDTGPTPDASNHRDGAVLRTDNNLEQGGFHGVSLHHAMTKYGLPAPANPSTDGSRPELSEENWVTPRTSGTSTRPNKTTPRQGLCLIEQVRDHVAAEEKQWGTPTARDHKSGRGNEEREYKELTPMVERSQSGKLNPRWVETLMGLPVGWVMPSCASPVTIELMNSDCWETELSQPQQNEHSEF